MKSNRRKFLKSIGAAGVGFGGAGIVPYFATKIVPEQEDNLVPAPDWLQKADMFVSAPWYITADKPDAINTIWKGYDIELKDVSVERIVRLAAANGLKKKHEQVLSVTDGTFNGDEIRGVALISHVPVSQTAFRQAHEQGFRVIPYVHFTDIHSFYADQDIFLFQHPEVLLKDAEGKWVHIPMDGSDRVYRLLICANNPRYCELSLAYLKKIMEWGADGLFIDNVGNRKECYANKSSKTVNPEFGPYVHEHLYPDDTHNYAFGRFLDSVHKLVKSYGDEKIVVLNSGIETEFQKYGDCCMWESFIYSWAWEGRRKEHSWTIIKERARNNEWYLKSGRRITALSTLNSSRTEVKDDAFWAFCAARLVDFIWWGSLKNTGAEQLYQTHLGNGLQPLQETDQLAFRTFENGVLVLNDSSQDKNKAITLPGEFKHKQLLDLYDGKNQIKVVKGQITVMVPRQTARVYIVPDNS